MVPQFSYSSNGNPFLDKDKDDVPVSVNISKAYSSNSSPHR